MSCDCSTAPKKLLYACSGAANVGLLADQVTRKLAQEGFGHMTCLAGLGAALSGFKVSAEGTEHNIVIDGCPVACGAMIFEKYGIACQSIVLTRMGPKKGETEITAELVAQIADQVKASIK